MPLDLLVIDENIPSYPPCKSEFGVVTSGINLKIRIKFKLDEKFPKNQEKLVIKLTLDRLISSNNDTTDNTIYWEIKLLYKLWFVLRAFIRRVGSINELF